MKTSSDDDIKLTFAINLWLGAAYFLITWVWVWSALLWTNRSAAN